MEQGICLERVSSLIIYENRMTTWVSSERACCRNCAQLPEPEEAISNVVFIVQVYGQRTGRVQSDALHMRNPAGQGH